jgi:Kinetochore complex Fta4 of Sim4 subunit, or CENP-50
MDPSSKTILALKSSFLRSQIRLLSAILQPSSTWRSPADEDHPTATAADDDDEVPSAPPRADLPQKTVDTVLEKVNTHLSAHNCAAYPQQTQHHIAEQIDALYWSDVTQQGLHPPQPDEVIVGRHIDLSTPEGLDALPAEYSDLFLHRAQQQVVVDDDVVVGDGGGGLLQERYAAARHYGALRARLEAAVAEQRRQRARLEGYRQLRRLLAPFEDAREGVQPNLVGREGELGRELDRLRVLAARFTGKIGEVGGSGVGWCGKDRIEEAGEEGRGEREKLGDVMDVL